uniref:Uncharacterized protein n=1 Tax=Mucochytrium quahogii TaxID=96639 RepID=A0A7S2SKH9_9STRA|mmetsp:Transcript_7636/g.12356  ORF Transcript_7636/g.12356 Transcript_7636/m.12356 type:complete len:309 (+) Transcript_7636:30-956(+)
MDKSFGVVGRSIGGGGSGGGEDSSGGGRGRGGGGSGRRKTKRDRVMGKKKEEEEGQEEGATFTRSNRFGGFDEDQSVERLMDTSSVLNSLPMSGGWLTREDPVWGVGDETDETMQKVLEQSYRVGRAEMTEAEMLQAAIAKSLVNEEEEKVLANQELEVRLASIFETHSEDIAAETLSLYEDCHDLDEALRQAISNDAERKLIADQESLIDFQFDSLEDLEPEIIAAAKKIYKEMASEQRRSGGRAPTVEFACSLAQDRAKDVARAKQQEEQEEPKEQEEEAESVVGRPTSRAERAAMMAAAFDRRHK